MSVDERMEWEACMFPERHPNCGYCTRPVYRQVEVVPDES